MKTIRAPPFRPKWHASELFKGNLLASHWCYGQLPPSSCDRRGFNRESDHFSLRPGSILSSQKQNGLCRSPRPPGLLHSGSLRVSGSLPLALAFLWFGYAGFRPSRFQPQKGKRKRENVYHKKRGGLIYCNERSYKHGSVLSNPSWSPFSALWRAFR